jgi:glycine/D-amino acid oxidase-like deaminating enzyme
MSVFNETEARNSLIAAWRYLAYLDTEKRHLVHALMPDYDGREFMVPCDIKVNDLNSPARGEDGDPISRAPEVLSFLGMDPYAKARWAGLICIDVSQIPIIGEVGKKRGA